MEKFLTFISSALFANIIALVGLLIAFLPQKDTISISHSTNYYFENETDSYKTNDRTLENIGYALKILFTYILYAFLYPYFSIILISLSLCVIIRYRYLKIKLLKQMFLPVILIILSIGLNFFLPNDVLSYWENTNKIDFYQFSSLSKTMEQLAHPDEELFNLFITASNTPLSVAVLANLVFISIATLMMINDLFKKKSKIKFPKLSDTIIILIFLSLIYSFIFYTNPNSISRLVIESISKFLKS